MSNTVVLLLCTTYQGFVFAFKAKSLGARLGLLSRIRPNFLSPEVSH